MNVLKESKIIVNKIFVPENFCRVEIQSLEDLERMASKSNRPIFIVNDEDLINYSLIIHNTFYHYKEEEKG